MNTCKHCGGYTNSKYCDKCGQKTGIIETNKICNERSDFLIKDALAKEQRKEQKTNRVLISLVLFSVLFVLLALAIALQGGLS